MEALQSAQAGLHASDADAMAAVVDVIGDRVGQTDLSDAEVRWLQDMYDGASTADLAERHGWSARTVARRLNVLYAKLGAISKVQAVAAAVHLGLLQLRPFDGRGDR